MKYGRVLSKNAGAARTAVAIPALNAYLTVFCFKASLMRHILCPVRPEIDMPLTLGVSIVLGACGFTFGKTGDRLRGT